MNFEDMTRRKRKRLPVLMPSLAAIMLLVIVPTAYLARPPLPPVALAGGQEGCTVVETYEGSGSLQTQPFEITADQWQVRYETSGSELLIDVYDAERGRGSLPVASITQDLEGGNVSAANAGPGSYYLDIFSVSGEWTVIAEECGDDGELTTPSPTSTPSPTPTSTPEPTTPPVDQPRTGGPPIMLAASALLFGAGAGLMVVNRRLQRLRRS